MPYQDHTDNSLARLVREGRGDAFAELSAGIWGLSGGRRGSLKGPAPRRRKTFGKRGFWACTPPPSPYNPECGAAFSTYAGVCVYNRMASAVRRQRLQRQPGFERVPPPGGCPGRRGGRAPGPSGAAGKFPSLPNPAGRDPFPLERRALGLYLSGVRRQEAAQRLGLSPRTFDNALHRARKKVKTLKTQSEV